MSERAQLTNLNHARDFALAGKARLTLVSRATGQRFTYRVSKKAGEAGGPHGGEPIWFVSLLTGPDNEGDYRYLGFLRGKRGRLLQSHKSCAGPEAPSTKAFAYFVRHVLQGTGDFPEQLEVWHEGRCGACGRALTVPASIEAGIGPVCAAR